MKIIAPLPKLLQKDAVRTWGNQQQSAFEELVHALTSALVLQMLQFDKPFIVNVNASDVAIGAVFRQEVGEIDISVCYYSKWLNAIEACWSIYECELYAIVQALSKWRCYLVSRHMVIYSDNQSLWYVTYQLKLLAKQQRQLDFLADFFIYVQFRLGKQNILPDALSWQPALSEDICPCSDASLSFMVLEPSWLGKVYQGQWSDANLGPFQRIHIIRQRIRIALGIRLIFTIYASLNRCI